MGELLVFECFRGSRGRSRWVFIKFFIYFIVIGVWEAGKKGKKLEVEGFGEIIIFVRVLNMNRGLKRL